MSDCEFLDFPSPIRYDKGNGFRFYHTSEETP